MADKKLQLLSTIRLPQNLKLLSDRLPKSKYEEDIIGDHKDASTSLLIPSDTGKHILVSDNSRAAKNGYSTNAG